MPGYKIEKYNPFFIAIRQIVRSEMRHGESLSFVSEVDLSSLEKARENFESKGLGKPSYTSFVVKAIALALKDFPVANRRPFPLPLGRRLVRFDQIDIAVAIEKEVPNAPMLAHCEVIRNANSLSLEQINALLQKFGTQNFDTSTAWRAFYHGIRWSPSWIFRFVMRIHSSFPFFWTQFRGGACMVSSPAKYGVDEVIGCWTHPLGVSFGQVKWRPVVVDGQIVARKTFALTLSWNRTVMAGAPAAKFFKKITSLLETAEQSL